MSERSPATSEELRLLYVTTGSHQEAVSIGRALVGEGLCACANVMSPMTSIYEWKDEVHEDPEVPLLLKTRVAQVERASARIVELHSYECPCVVVLPVVGGHQAFLDWVAAQTGARS